MNRITKLIAAASMLLLPSAAIAQQPTIKIGSIFVMTGPAASFGAAASEGLRYAIEDVNKAGGLDVNGTKYKVELIVYDDQLKPAEAVSAYSRLVEKDQAKYIFNMISASHMAIKPMAEADNVFVLTAAISGKAIDADTKHIVRIQSLVQDYLPGIVKWMKGNVSGDRAALIYPNDESGWDFANMTTAEFGKVGYTIVSKELVDRSVKDFQPMLTRVIATNPDIIDLGPTAPATAGLIVRQARELGYKKSFAVLAGAGAKGILDFAGADVAEGIIFMVYADPGNPGYKTLAERYRQKFNQAPLEVLVNYYDGAMALMKAIQVAGDPNNPIKVREAFPKVFPFKSIQGESLAFGGKDSIGVDAQVFTTNYIAVIKKGETVVVGASK